MVAMKIKAPQSRIHYDVAQGPVVSSNPNSDAKMKSMQVPSNVTLLRRFAFFQWTTPCCRSILSRLVTFSVAFHGTSELRSIFATQGFPFSSYGYFVAVLLNLHLWVPGSYIRLPHPRAAPYPRLNGSGPVMNTTLGFSSLSNSCNLANIAYSA